MKNKNENTKRNLDRKYIGKTNVADYNVPAGDQLTENIVEEIVEAVSCETPEAPVEKK